MKKQFATGLALSGGGVRGLAHLGVWKALKEQGVEIQRISGTSAGSLVGAFLSAGFEPEEVLKLFAKKGIFDFARVRIPSKGLLELKGLEDFLQAELPYENIEDLPIPLTVTVSEIQEGKVYYFNEGPLAKLLTASSCIPVLFAPIVWKEYLLVDGGLFDNLPVMPIRSECEQVIAVNATPSGEVRKLRNILEISQRVFELGAASELSKREADVLIEPQGLLNIPLLDARKASEAFQMGFDAAIARLSSHQQ